MPRRARQAVGGLVHHVLNRGNLRAAIFHKNGDYEAFERILQESWQRTPVELFAWCLMPNHWHRVLRPRRDGDLAEFMGWRVHDGIGGSVSNGFGGARMPLTQPFDDRQECLSHRIGVIVPPKASCTLGWLTVTHTQRWRAHSHSEGEGHLHQGRYKSFPVQTDRHFLRVGRYMERNALWARLVPQAQDWRWSSLWRQTHRSVEQKLWLSPWPVAQPTGWLEGVNRPMRASEEEAVRQSVKRGRPYGDPGWQARTAASLGLEQTFRNRGRPRKEKE